METNSLHKGQTVESCYLRTLEEGAKISVDHGAIELPEWYDEVKFRRGQEYFKGNFHAMFLGKLCGLLAILTVPSILRVLVHTHQSSEPLSAYKRYVATVMHTLEWYYEAMVPSSRAWKSIAFVRKTHAGVSKQAATVNPDMIISQRDMAITQFGFIGYSIISYKKLGVQFDRTGMEAFVHFWRVIGHMIGIEDRFNACTDSYDTTEQRMSQIARGILQPALLSHSDEFVKMGKALIEGLWCFNPTIEFDRILFVTMRLTNIPGYHYWDNEVDPSWEEPKNKQRPYDHFGWLSRFMLYSLCYIHSVLLKFAIFRWYFNALLVLSRYLITYFPFLAFYRFGVSQSYVRILK